MNITPDDFAHVRDLVRECTALVLTDDKSCLVEARLRLVGFGCGACNVLIYFDTPTRREILGKLHGLPRPEGSLFLRGSENLLDLKELFERVQYGRCDCYQPR